VHAVHAVAGINKFCLQDRSVPYSSLYLVCKEFKCFTPAQTSLSSLQDSSAPLAGGGGGLGGFGLLGGDGGGQGSSSGGLGLGLLDGMDASSLGWDGSTFSQGMEQLNQVGVIVT